VLSIGWRYLDRLTTWHRKGRLTATDGSVVGPEGAVKCLARPCFCLRLLLIAVLLGLFPGGRTALGDTRVWEWRFGEERDRDYPRAVEELFASFEEIRARPLEPGASGRVGLKVYTQSGPGLATPRDLVRAVVVSLERRGFERENIFLVDQSRFRLQQAGFLERAQEDRFEGSPVYVLESGAYYDGDWHYESPLPPRTDFRRMMLPGIGLPAEDEAFGVDRLSYLAFPLLHNVDFWINLPRYTDHPNLGVNGALLNATLWNASNTGRFLGSRSAGSAAAAEMAAIPELRERWLLNLTTLDSYQFIAGPAFRSLYTAAKPVLWMSADPVLLDALMAAEIDRERRSRGFSGLGEYLPLLDFAEQLGVGRSDPGTVEWIRLPENR
jgi:hypothetical protein